MVGAECWHNPPTLSCGCCLSRERKLRQGMPPQRRRTEKVGSRALSIHRDGQSRQFLDGTRKAAHPVVAAEIRRTQPFVHGLSMAAISGKGYANSVVCSVLQTT